MSVVSVYINFKSPCSRSGRFQTTNNSRGLLFLTLQHTHNTHTHTHTLYIYTNTRIYMFLLYNILYFFYFLFLPSSNFTLSSFTNLLSLPLLSFFVVLIYFQDIHLLLFSTVFVFSSDFPYFFAWERRRYRYPTVRNTKTYNHKVEKEQGVRTDTNLFILFLLKCANVI